MGEILSVDVPSVLMLAAGEYGAETVNQLVYGEQCIVINEYEEQYVQIRALHDEYEGFVLKNALGGAQDSTHSVCVPCTHIYEKPDFKSVVRMPLYMQSRVFALGEVKNGFRALDCGGWVFHAHLTDIDKTQDDHVETALSFLHVPYLWGGRTFSGIDCSGLVQIALMMAGVPCPRDSGPQSERLGQNIEFGDKIQYATLQRGDFMFFKGHVGIMLDERQILNATARHMQVVIEDLDDVAAAYEEIIAVRRL